MNASNSHFTPHGVASFATSCDSVLRYMITHLTSTDARDLKFDTWVNEYVKHLCHHHPESFRFTWTVNGVSGDRFGFSLVPHPDGGMHLECLNYATPGNYRLFMLPDMNRNALGVINIPSYYYGNIDENYEKHFLAVIMSEIVTDARLTGLLPSLDDTLKMMTHFTKWVRWNDDPRDQHALEQLASTVNSKIYKPVNASIHFRSLFDTPPQFQVTDDDETPEHPFDASFLDD